MIWKEASSLSCSFTVNVLPFTFVLKKADKLPVRYMKINELKFSIQISKKPFHSLRTNDHWWRKISNGYTRSCWFLVEKVLYYLLSFCSFFLIFLKFCFYSRRFGIKNSWNKNNIHAVTLFRIVRHVQTLLKHAIKKSLTILWYYWNNSK